MSSYVPFNERDICLNCPKTRCVYEGNNGATCPIIKEKREEHRREQKEKRRKPCKNFSRSAT